ncbi:MAG: heat-inducible transcriptional repressor HrcA [Bacilli bacterium]|nr:heat-inducible transcriptional repressor HrcA [Bacilli bacterium]MDD4809420.1 heat-inducible transcriptional repressor HrcA [Bacilli bacterium]
MLNQRQTEILKEIVEDYIETARPISSNSLCKKMKCSSATIRNEMGFLEENGLIEKTHISSGRIPSEQGYRYYVDNIMKPKEITGDDMLKLQTIFYNNSLMLDDTIIKSMEIISEITNYTAVVLGSASSENKVNKVEVVPLSENRLIAIVITDKGHVEHRNMLLEGRVSSDEIKQTVELINKLIVGTPINEVSSKLEFEVKPIISKYVKQHEVLYNAFYNAFNDFANNSNVVMKGTSHILKQPEFNDIDKIRDIVSKFEGNEMVNSIKEEENGINIYIGSENEFDDNVTIIKTKYEINGNEGTLALIGPKRMEYDRVISLLDYIKKNIER